MAVINLCEPWLMQTKCSTIADAAEQLWNWPVALCYFCYIHLLWTRYILFNKYMRNQYQKGKGYALKDLIYDCA